MAIVLRGMTAEETASLTDAMVRSGVRVDLSRACPASRSTSTAPAASATRPRSILAPLAAACGAVVPMMSGRGLGHTGGTLDKLESIPGFRTACRSTSCGARSRTIGCAMIGQTAEIAPADRKLYALRDVTGTVESIPLISASIMSKKIAEGIGGAGARREERRRRVHEDRGATRARWPQSLVAIGDAGRRADRGADHRHGRAARPRRRQRARDHRVDRDAEGARARGPRDAVGASWRRGCWCWPASSATMRAARRRGSARRWRRAPASRSSAQIIEHQGGDPRVDRRLRAACRRRPIATSVAAPRDGVRRPRCAPSGRPRRGRARRRPRPARRRRSIPAVGIGRGAAGDAASRRASRSLDDSSSRRPRPRRGAARCCDGAIEIADAPPAGRRSCVGSRLSRRGADDATEPESPASRRTSAPPRAPVRARATVVVLGGAAAAAAVCALAGAASAACRGCSRWSA